MKGQDRLIEARMHGRAPSVGVYVETGDSLPWFEWLESKAPGFPSVWVEPGDDPKLLDLRCLIGLRVCIGATEGRDWADLADCCVKAGAKEVAVTGYVDGHVAVLWHSKDAHADYP